MALFHFFVLITQLVITVSACGWKCSEQSDISGVTLHYRLSKNKNRDGWIEIQLWTSLLQMWVCRGEIFSMRSPEQLQHKPTTSRWHRWAVNQQTESVQQTGLLSCDNRICLYCHCLFKFKASVCHHSSESDTDYFYYYTILFLLCFEIFCDAFLCKALSQLMSVHSV